MNIPRAIAKLRQRRVGQVTGLDRALAVVALVQYAGDLAPFLEGRTGARALAVTVENWIIGGIPPREIVRSVLKPGVLLVVHRHHPDFIGTGRLAEVLDATARVRHCWVLVDSDADAGLAELNPPPKET